jgi:hypothetical protein
MLKILPYWIKGLKHVLARWLLAKSWRAEAGRHGMAKPTSATGSGFTATSIASRDDDESFPFPQDLRHRYGKSDSDPPPSWWSKFSQ